MLRSKMKHDGAKSFENYFLCIIVHAHFVGSMMKIWSTYFVNVER